MPKKYSFGKITQRADTSGFEGSAKRIIDAIVNGSRKLGRVDVSNLFVSDNARDDE